RMHPVIAGTTAGVETDVLGLHLDNIRQTLLDQVVAAHPRPQFKERILAAFHDGFADRPDSTFGTVNADVLDYFTPGFDRGNFVDIIRGSAWPN
ncbi:MAG: diguanylate cyclase, partial [Frondihabitans sp.]|nr:diguanylate cyclase [Frondihabitans sp.]